MQPKEDTNIDHLKKKIDDQATPLPLVARGVYSLVADMKLGWKPKSDIKPKYLYEVPPVVAFTYTDDDQFEKVIPPTGGRASGLQKYCTQVEENGFVQQTVYRGFRPRDSLELHECYKYNKEFYTFDYPSYTNLKPQQFIVDQ